LSEASVWSTSSISRPDCARSDRPSALTTPVVTVAWKPNGLPIAIATWPTRTRRDSPSTAGGTPSAAIRTTARSVSGSSPTSVAGTRRPSASIAVIFAAPWTTWLFVSTKPSVVNTNPEPEPSARPRRSACSTSIFTTEGETRSTAPTTASE
jgi:hypothetical protein